MADIWMYVTKHVKSDATVQIIKGNLSLHSRAQTEVAALEMIVFSIDLNATFLCHLCRIPKQLSLSAKRKS